MDNWQLSGRKIILDHPMMRAVVDTLSRDGISWQYTYLESPVDSATTVAITDQREIVRQLWDPVAFANLTIDSDTVVWANGFDLAPEFLRAKLDTDAAA